MSTRDEIKKILAENAGKYISGAEIAERLGISGTAVWKAVKKLQAEGWHIDAVTNKGYSLNDSPDILSPAIISERLENSRFTANLRPEVFSSVGSTNTICKDKAAAGEPGGYVAIASNQTQGRGRRGRSFFSPDGTGLYMSILLRPAGMKAEEALRFTTIAAVAVAEAIEEVTGADAKIKWVNDIYVNERKVCGILTEASFDLESGTLDYAVVGIGINVYTPDNGFPEELSGIAGSVCGPAGDCGIADCRSLLAAAVLERFALYCADPGRTYIGKYRDRCFVIGRSIDVIAAGSDPVKAVATGLDDECRLLVRYEDGTTAALSSGEISIRFERNNYND